MSKTVRTRFAPSPTGFLHVGGLRTALYAFLFARQNNGQFILRIEDTDQERTIEGATENLLKALMWSQIDWDEGPVVTLSPSKDDKLRPAKRGQSDTPQKGPHSPYIQSKRSSLYKKFAQELLDNDKAYHCFCTKERLTEMREQQIATHKAPMYDGHCRDLSPEEVKKELDAKTPFVIRQKIPRGEFVEFTDLVRGHLKFDTYTLDDQVLMKSDGFPTYHLANVVDDHLMEITHVIRGEEWLPSTPKHVLLYAAFGWEKPEFAHLPLLLNKDKTKLSKRQGHVAVEDYEKQGYLPKALVNFVALLGWHPKDDQEVFSMDDLIKNFSLDRVQKSGAVFDIEKLDWINGVYIREKSPEDLATLVLPYLKNEKWFQTVCKNVPNYKEDLKYLENALSLIRGRLKKLSDAPAQLKLFYLNDFDYDPKLFINEKMKVDQKMVKIALEKSLAALEKLESFEDEEAIKECLLKVVTDLNVKNGQVLWPLRVALSNEQFSPGVFEMIKVLGRDRSLERIKKANKSIKT